MEGHSKSNETTHAHARPPNSRMKAFDIVNHTKLIEKLKDKTDIPPLYLKFLANYIQERKGFTVFENSKSSQRNFHTSVPQGGVLSPQLFNIYIKADRSTPFFIIRGCCK